LPLRTFGRTVKAGSLRFRRRFGAIDLGNEQDKKLRFESQGSSSFVPDWPREIRIESPEGKLLKSVPWKGKTFEVELPS
jgi:hypothetical protein